MTCAVVDDRCARRPARRRGCAALAGRASRLTTIHVCPKDLPAARRRLIML
jgi:hypothetical protein